MKVTAENSAITAKGPRVVIPRATLPDYATLAAEKARADVDAEWKNALAAEMAERRAEYIAENGEPGKNGPAQRELGRELEYARAEYVRANPHPFAIADEVAESYLPDEKPWCGFLRKYVKQESTRERREAKNPFGPIAVRVAERDAVREERLTAKAVKGFLAKCEKANNAEEQEKAAARLRLARAFDPRASQDVVLAKTRLWKARKVRAETRISFRPMTASLEKALKASGASTPEELEAYRDEKRQARTDARFARECAEGAPIALTVAELHYRPPKADSESSWATVRAQWGRGLPFGADAPTPVIKAPPPVKVASLRQSVAADAGIPSSAREARKMEVKGYKAARKAAKAAR